MRKIKRTLNKNEGCIAKVINAFNPHISDKARDYMRYKPYGGQRESKESGDV